MLQASKLYAYTLYMYCSRCSCTCMRACTSRYASADVMCHTCFGLDYVTRLFVTVQAKMPSQLSFDIDTCTCTCACTSA